MGKLAPLPSFIEISKCKMEKEKTKLTFLFSTMCIFTNNSSKEISYQYIKEKAFITPRYLALATWNALRRNNALFPKRVAILANRMFRTLVARLTNGFKCVAKQNQDICMPQICAVMLLGCRLDGGQLKND